METHPLGMAEYQLLGDGFGYHSGYAAAGSGGSGQPPGQPGSQPTSHQAGQSGVLNSAGLAGPGSQAYHQLGPHGGPPVRQLGYGPGDPGKIHDQYSAAYGSSSAVGSTQSSQLARSQYGPHDPRYQHNLSSYASSIGQSHLGLSQHPNAPPSQSSSLGQLSSASYQSRSLMGQYPDQRMHGPGLTPRPGGPVHGLPGHYPGSYSSSPYGHPGHSSSGDLWSSQGLQHMQQRPPYYPNAPHPPSQSGGVSMHGPRGQSQFVHNQNDYSAMHQSQRPYYQGSGTGSQGPQSSAVASHIPGESSAMSSYSSSSYNAPSSAQSSSRSSHSANSRQQSQAQFSMSYNAPNSALQPPPPSASQQTVPTQGSTANVPRYPHQQYSGYSSQTNYDSSAGQSRLSPYGLPPSGPQGPNSPSYRPSYPSSSAQVAALSPRRPTPTPPAGSPMPPTSHTPDRVTAAAAAAGASTTPQSQGYPSPGANQLTSPNQGVSPSNSAAGSNSQSQPPVAPPPPPPPTNSLQQLEQMVMPHLSSSGSSSKTNSTSSGPPSSSAPTSSYYGLSTQGSGSSNSQLSQSSSQYSHYSPPTSISHQQPSSHSYYQQYQQNSGLWQASGNQAPPTSTSSSSLPNTHSPLGTGSGVSSLQPQAPVPYSSTAQVSQQPATKASLQSPQHTNSSGSSTSSTSINTNVTSKTSASNMSNSSTVGAQQYNMFDSQFATNSSVADSGFSKSSASENSVMSPRQGISQQSQQQSSQQQSQGPQPPSAQQQPAPPQSMSSFDISSLTKPNASYETSNTQNQKSEEQDRKDSPRDKEYSQKQKTGESQSGSNADQPTNFYDVLSPADTAPMSSESIMSRENQKQDQSSVTGNQTTQPPISNDQPPFMSQPVADQQNFLAPHQGDQSYMSSQPQQPGMYHPQQPYGHQHQSQMPPYGSNYGDSYDMGMGNEPMNSMNAPYGPSHESMMYDQGYNQPGMESMMGPGGHMGDYGGGHMGDMSTMPPYDPYDDTFASEPSTKRKGKGRPKKDPSEPKKEKKPRQPRAPKGTRGRGRGARNSIERLPPPPPMPHPDFDSSYPMGPDSADLYSQMMPQPPPMPQHQMPGPPPMGQPPPPPSMQASIQQQQMNHSMQPPPHMPGSMTQVPNDIYQPPNLNQAALQSQQNSSQLQMALEPPNVFDAVSPQTQHAQSTALVPTSQLQSQPQPSAASLPPSTQQPQLTQDQQQPQTQSQQQPLSTPPSQLQQQPHSDTDIQAFDGDATTIQPDNHEASAETTASTKTQSASATVDHVNNNSENTATEQMQCDDLFSQSTNSNSLETPMFTVSSEDTSNTVPPSSQPEPLPSLQCDPQPKSPTPQLPSLPIATPPPPPPQLPPPLVPVSSPGNDLNSSSFDFAEESTTVATPTKKKGKKRKAKDEACLGSGEEVERKPKKVKKRKSKSQQEQNKEEIDVKIENPLSDVLPDGDKSVVEPQSTEFDDATQEDTSQLDFNAGETSAKAKKGRNREGKTKKPKLKESKSKLPKKKLPKLALKFGKKKKRKRLGSSDNSDLERTPPPSPDEAESGILKRRSARNTKRQKYTDDIDLEISEDESKLGLKDKEGGSLQDTSPQAGVLLMNVHEDAMVVEKFLGVRMATREVESENVEGDENPNPTTVEVEEFYVKYKNLSYLHCEWKTEEELEKGDKRIAQKIKRFKQKKDSMNMFDFLDDEPFNPDYCEVDRILDVNEVEEWVDIVEEVKPKCEEKKEEVKEPEEDVKKTEEKLENESQDEPIKSEVENADAVLDEELIEKSSSVVEEKQEKSNSSETEEPKKESNSEEEPDVKTPEEKIEEKSIMDEAVTETIKKDTETKKPKIVRHYLVKWRALPYEECNWELEDDLDPQKIELFWRFRDPPPKDKWKPKKRPKMTDWKKLDVSPVYRSGNTLREYQLEGVNWLMFCWHNNRNCILADEMGLGKTIQSLAFVQEIVKYGINGPFLVIAPLSTIGNWQREFETWTDLNVITYHGSSASRNMLQEYEMYYKDAKGERIEGIYKFQVMITTFEIILTDCMELRGISWRCCIIDEAHRLKNRNCKLLEGLRLLDMEHRVLLTGTPLQNNVEELFSLLNFLEPSQFASSEVFLLEFGDLKTEEQVDKLKALLKPMMLRRLKEDVEKSLAPKEETIIEVELTNIQKKYYRAILERNFQFLSKGGTCANMPNLMNTMMELRKCCIHPFLINGAEEQVMYEYKHQHGDSPESQLKAMVHASGKLVLIDKLLPRLRSDGHRVLIFSQMVRCLDILEDYIVQKRYPYERIDGRVRGNLRQAAIDRFCKPDSDRFVFLLCTRAGGLGINLTAADTVIIFDSDWNPQNDLQAQARCHRIGQSKMVKVYRLICRNTYEREMFDKASLKLGLDKAVLQSMNTQKSIADNAMSKKEVEDLLRKGAYGAIMDDDNAGDKFCEEDIEQILQRRTRVITVESEEQGSIFSKASFAASDNRSDIEIDDPNFWEKWAKKAQLDVDELKGRNELIVQEPRKRTQTKRFGQDDSLMDITDVDSSEDDEDVAMRTRGSRGRLKGKKGRKGRGGGYERERDEDYLEEFGPGNWTRAECYKVEKGLLTYGWARWPEFVKFGNFRRQLSEQDIEDIARVILLFCVQNYKGDEKIKSFIWDLISPVEQNSQKGNKNLGGLTASLSRGRKNKKSKRSIAEEVMSSDWAKDENYNPDFLLTDDQYRKHLHRHANKILLRVRLLNYLKQEIIGDLSEMVEVGRHAREIPIPTPMADGDPPSTWWDEEADRSLLIGVYKHGYDRYNLMRHDPALCFLHRCGPPDNAALYAEINDDDLGRTLDEDEEPETPATPATPSDSTKSESVKDDMEANDMSNGSLPFPSHADMNQRFRRIITAYQRNFKKQELRLAQQARHQQRLEKLERFEAAIKERESKKREQAQKKWSRREESDFYRVVSSFGVEYNRREDKYDWSRFRSFSRLEKKLDETLTEYFKAFYAMCKRVTGRRLTEEEENLPISVDPISDERASRSLARIDLLSKIREEILPHPELNERLQLCQPSIELPDWWICGQHDKDLLIGAARYGLNRLDFHLMHDPEFSFKDVLKNEDSDSKQKDMDNSLLNKDVKESDEIKTAVAEEPVPEVDDIKQQEVLDKEIKNEPLEEKSEKETVKESDSLEKIDKSSSDDEKKEPATEEDREKPKQEEQSEKVEPEKLETDDTATGVTKDMAPVDSEHVETEDPVPKESTKDEESAPSKEMVEATSQPDIKTADEKMEVDNDMTKDPAFKNSAENEDEKKENTEDEKVSVESNMKTEPVFDPPSDIKAIVKVSGDELQHSLASVSQVRTPIRWPKDRVLQMRLEQVCHCVEKNEWQSFRQAFFTGLTGTVPSTPSIATADSSPRAASPGSISSVSREPTPHPTPEHTPRRESLSPLNDYMFESGGSATDSANRRRRRRRKRFEVEAERAKLRNLLSQGIEQQSSKKSNPMSTPLTSSLLNPSLFPPLFNLPFCNMRPDLRNELLNDEKTAILIGNALNQIQSKPPNSASGPPPAHQNSASRRTNPLDTLDLRFKTTPAIVPPPNSAPPAHKPTITTNSSSNKEKPSAKPSSPISVLDLSSGPSAKREPDHKNESGDGNRNVSNVSKKPASKKIGSRIDALALNLQAKKMMQEKQTDKTENAPHGEGKTPQTDVRSKDSFGKLDLNKYQTRQARYPTPPAAHSSSMPTSKLSENHNFIKSQTPSSQLSSLDATKLPPSKASEASSILEQAAAIRQDLKKWLEDHPEFVAANPSLAAAAAAAMSFTPNVSSIPANTELLELPEGRRRGRRPKVDPTQLDVQHLTGDENVSVINRLTGKKITGSKAPPLKHLAEWLEKNPMFDVDPKWSPLIREKVPSFKTPTNVSSTSSIRTRTSDRRLNDMNMASSSVSGGGSSSRRTTAASLLAQTQAHSNAVSSAGASSSTNSTNFAFPHSAMSPLNFNPSLLSGFPSMKMFMDSANMCPTTSTATSSSSKSHTSSAATTSTAISSACSTSSSTTSTTTPPMFFPFGGLAGMGLGNPLFGFPGFSLPGLTPGSNPLAEFTGGKKEKDSNSGSNSEKSKSSDKNLSISKSKSASSGSNSNNNASSLFGSGASSSMGAGGLPFLYPTPNFLYNPLGLGGFSLPTSPFASLAAQTGLMNGLGGLGTTAMSGLTTTTTTTSSANHSKSRNSSSSSNAHKNSSNSSSKHYSNAHGSSLSNLPTSLPFSASANVLSSSSGNASKGATLPESDDDSLKSLMGNDEDDENDVNGDLDEHETGGKGDSDSDYEKSISRKRSSSSKSSSKDLSKSKKSNNSAATSKVLS